ncbi:MAG: hypothetical protein DDG59_02430 [Anaerolineae bacterium]|jgi:UDP-N-acetylmuramate dehydrogenase|nr:MAG: hypothetical protein DDG59_02430 [Anaerolineae bacterium]
MNATVKSLSPTSAFTKLLEEITQKVGLTLQSQVPLARYTAARIGGNAEFFVEVNSSSKLEQLISLIWEKDIPYTLLGGGSNVLISDEGLPGLVIINRARGRARIRFDDNEEAVLVWADAGVTLTHLARQAAERGFSGLEWACGIPGTVGGAVVNNAGAFGGNMAGNFVMATILHRKLETHQVRAVQEQWTLADMEYRYRSSRLKDQPNQAVVLAALLRLERGNPQEIKAKMDQYNQHRRRTQPPGASLGSMFKNPPGDFAGRLIEQAGLKGLTVGRAMISPMHANFFINLGNASANDVWQLIQVARQTVAAKFGIQLELEIQPLGIFPEPQTRTMINSILEVHNG